MAASYSLNKVIWVHKDAPNHSQKILQQGMENLIEDTSFEEESQDILEGYDAFVGEELNNQIEQSFSISPDTKKWIIEYLQLHYDIDINKL